MFANRHGPRVNHEALWYNSGGPCGLWFQHESADCLKAAPIFIGVCSTVLPATEALPTHVRLVFAASWPKLPLIFIGGLRRRW